MNTSAALRPLLIAFTLLLVFAASPLAADPRPKLDFSMLPSGVANQVRSVLSKANTLARMPALVLQGAGAAGPSTPSLSVPILTASPRSQVSASSKIGLAWVGGSAAYKAQLMSGAAAPVVTTQVSTARAVFTANTIAPGTYNVQITDSSGSTATGAFDVTQNGPTLNPDPIEQYRGRVPPPVFAIAKASLFAKQGHQFYLQAYQLLSAYPNYPDAVNLSQVLVQGVSVK